MQMNSAGVSSGSQSSDDDHPELAKTEIEDFDSGDEVNENRSSVLPAAAESGEGNSFIEVIAKSCFPNYAFNQQEDSRSTPVVPVSSASFDQSNQEILSQLKDSWDLSEAKARFDSSVSQFETKSTN